MVTPLLISYLFPLSYICRTVSIRAIKLAASVAPCKSGNASSVLTLTRKVVGVATGIFGKKVCMHVRWHRNASGRRYPPDHPECGKRKSRTAVPAVSVPGQTGDVGAMPLHKQHHLPVGQVNLPAVAEAEPAGSRLFLFWLMCLLPVVQAARPYPADSRVVQFSSGWRPAHLWPSSTK